MMNDKITKVIDNIFKKTADLKQVHECALYIENMNVDFSYRNSYGDREIDDPFVIASITKLFTTTCILAMKDENLLSLDEKVSYYFSDETMKGLHIYNGVDYSWDLTIANLLFQNSGLPDYYDEGKSSVKRFILSEDFYFDIEKKIESVKKLKPHFAPGTLNKAYYSDVNFDMLGEIIEIVLDMSLEEAYKKYIFKPLGLTNTYLPKNEDSFVPSMYYKDKIITRPKFISSSKASGGAISTTNDLMIFIKSFFNGKLFNKENFKELMKYNKLQSSMGPINYGGGFMQIPLEGIYTLFQGKGELIGHSGSTGSFAFYFPLKDMFITGNINQVADQALPIRFIMKLAFALKD